MKTTLLILCAFCISSKPAYSQTVVNLFLDSIEMDVGAKYTPGVFYVPKTTEAQTDFLNNGIHQNSIRLNIIEGALNNTTNLNDCLLYLDNVSSILQTLSAKTDNLLFIFEKMPVWLSSSSDGSPATTPGWFVLNTKPPSDYNNWNAMVTAVTDRIVNIYGIANAQFEIWNEPDLGSWTGSKSEYFELFQNTYDAIKAVNTSIPTGGPATNHWGKNIGYQQPFGYLSNAIGDSSLIGELLDSTLVWNKPLDFISWHNFNFEYQTNQNAIEYITQKCSSLGLPLPELIVSEWNTPSAVRDTPMQKSFFIKSQMETAKTTVTHNMVAAWQDFDQLPQEFHSDYGMLTYGSIHKPAYKALLLSEKLKGKFVKTIASNADVISTVSNDTLHILLVNFTPPAFIEAFHHTLFEGQLNVNQLDSAGFINISTGDLSALLSVYNGQTSISNSSAVNIAINNSIPVFNHLDSLQLTTRQYEINIDNLSGVHSGKSFSIDDSVNNSQFHYNSLLLQGFTQNNAIDSIASDQSLSEEITTMNNGLFNTTLQPNSIRLFQFVIPELLNTGELAKNHTIQIYPNPTNSLVNINSSIAMDNVQVLDITGRIIEEHQNCGTHFQMDTRSWESQVYVISIKNGSGLQQIKILKE